jgi:DNA-binding transcriptional LysR family regulator
MIAINELDGSRMTSHLEPDLLRTFIAIAETSRFTEAARRVGRTQSAVSMQMRRLEERLGRPLLTRQGRGTALTPDGELLLGHARRVLRAHADAEAAFDGASLDGRVRIGSPDDYASSFLPGILARFARTHPRVEVELVCEPSSGLLRLVDAGEVDLALVTQGSGEAEGTIVHREPLVWAGAADHDAHLVDPLPLALFHQGCVFRRSALDALAAQGRSSRIAYTSISVAGIYAALSAGLAVGVLPRSAVRSGLRILGAACGLPLLPTLGIILVKPPGASTVIRDALERHVVASLATPPLLVAA